MAVKDTSRVPEGWAYYNFGGSMMGGLRTSAAPQPKASCYNCHIEHAARDNVFMQFYQMLRDVDPRATQVERRLEPAPETRPLQASLTVSKLSSRSNTTSATASG